VKHVAMPTLRDPASSGPLPSQECRLQRVQPDERHTNPKLRPSCEPRQSPGNPPRRRRVGPGEHRRSIRSSAPERRSPGGSCDLPGFRWWRGQDLNLRPRVMRWFPERDVLPGRCPFSHSGEAVSSRRCLPLFPAVYRWLGTSLVHRRRRIAARSSALSPANTPPNAPTGIRTGLRMTTS
jgi:hypothetical protein